MDCVHFGDDNPGYGQIIHKSWKPRIHIHRQGLTKTAIPKKSRVQTAADVGHWSETFESLLSDHNGQMVFRAFLKSEFCEENIEFWLACEEFKCKKTKEILASTAVDIYEQFIKTNSPKQINLDFHTRECIAQSLQQPTTSCFAEAQKKVYHLMKNDVYPRFIQSDFYNELRAVASTGAKRNHRRILH